MLAPSEKESNNKNQTERTTLQDAHIPSARNAQPVQYKIPRNAQPVQRKTHDATFCHVKRFNNIRDKNTDRGMPSFITLTENR